MMNEQLWHKLFAEKITKEYIGKLTGEEIPRIEGKVPEDLFIVGQLAPASTNMASYITSRVIINGIGVNFNIPVEDIPNAVSMADFSIADHTRRTLRAIA